MSGSIVRDSGSVSGSGEARRGVLFICVKNGGKSQMAAALMRQVAGQDIEVHSAGTRPGTALNALSMQVLDEVGAPTAGEEPKPIDPGMLARMDVVVTLGEEAQVDTLPGPRFETWVTDEPSERGIDGIDRMRLVRDDIAARVRVLAAELTGLPARGGGAPEALSPAAAAPYRGISRHEQHPGETERRST